jgi:hypothetical protein
MKRFAIILLSAASLSGCIARTAVDLVTAPVRVGSAAVDLATTSASEAAAAKRRAERRQAVRRTGLEQAYARHAEQCRAGNRDACARRDATYAEIEKSAATTDN